jgi:hypothetical protein
MMGNREFETIAKINARTMADFDGARHVEERVHGNEAILKIIARQIAAFQLLNSDFDARRFCKLSGITEDWMQSRVIGWAAKDE